ncbi:spry domain-containing protein [Cystoisospora suis]|uniref:Spry domain-containing protein n=1 Tax=Cystoisospora suis TaxID=483139 RepID=A0A2C6KQ50_9APIC|nr:spry domain-containing protein [Cystoisospora suis]
MCVGAHLGVCCWSPLEILVRHLVACRQLIRECTGNRGAIPSSTLYCCPPPLRLLLNPSASSSSPSWSLISSFSDHSVELPLIYNP